MSLNESQQRAVEHYEGPLLVNAGPGSGKTRVVTERTARLIERGVEPSSILLVTFTNKAAREMRRRLGKRVGSVPARRVWSGTFHGICARILRMLEDDVHRDGRKKDFSIYDQSDSVALVRHAVDDLCLDRKVWSPTELHGRISRLKGEGMVVEDFVADDESGETARKIWVGYEALLLRANAFDFDDLQGVVMRLVEGTTRVGEALRSRWRFVVVDEYQDTNEVQFRLVKALSQSRNLCVVGDHRQAIFSFRGADHRNILLFNVRYPDATTVDLDVNYRSDGHIVSCFNALFGDVDMRPRVGRQDGVPVTVLPCSDESQEASSVCSRIFSMLNRSVPPSEIAVLYRVHALSRAIEERLRNQAIKYQVVGGLSFYDRAVVKDVLAYLRLVVNPDSDVDLERVVNTPRRAVSDKTVARIRRCASDRQCSLWQAIPAAICDTSAPKTVQGLQRFCHTIKHAREDLAKMDLTSMVSRLLDTSGYRDYLQKEVAKFTEKRKTAEADKMAQSILNVEQVVNAVESYCERTEGPTLAGYLEEVALMTDQDELKDGAVSLMTIHAAKGLEFEGVFVVGCEDGLLPFSRAVTPAELQEERRLFFVAVSRAKSRLTLSYADERMMYGQVKVNRPSEFLKLLPDESVQGGRAPEVAAGLAEARW